MFCIHCGTEQIDGAKYCHNCGETPDQKKNTGRSVAKANLPTVLSALGIMVITIFGFTLLSAYQSAPYSIGKVGLWDFLTYPDGNYFANENAFAEKVANVMWIIASVILSFLVGKQNRGIWLGVLFSVIAWVVQSLANAFAGVAGFLLTKTLLGDLLGMHIAGAIICGFLFSRLTPRKSASQIIKKVENEPTRETAQ